MSLRICKKCGFIAHDEIELELFAKGVGYIHGRLQLCKKCFNEGNREKRNIERSLRPKIKYLRKCRRCGLEAITKEDLELFTTDNRLKYGKDTICKKCYSIIRIGRYASDPKYKERASRWHHEKSKKTKFKRKLLSIGKPILCYFCGKEIIILNGRPHGDSLVIHSLDGNHNNWDDNNKVPAHQTCHMSYSNIGNTRNNGVNNHNYGKHLSEETKKKISVGNKGKIISEESRKKMSISAKNRYSKLLKENL